MTPDEFLTVLKEYNRAYYEFNPHATCPYWELKSGGRIRGGVEVHCPITFVWERRCYDEEVPERFLETDDYREAAEDLGLDLDFADHVVASADKSPGPRFFHFDGELRDDLLDACYLTEEGPIRPRAMGMSDEERLAWAREVRRQQKQSQGEAAPLPDELPEFVPLPNLATLHAVQDKLRKEHEG